MEANHIKLSEEQMQGLKEEDRPYYRRLCRNILAGRFNWQKYCTPGYYFGREICVTPLHASYGQIGYIIYFPYTCDPEVEFDWEKGEITITRKY